MNIAPQILVIINPNLKRIGAILFFSLVFSVLGFCQKDTVAHLYTFGGNGNDYAEEIKATADGGYIVIGSTSSNSWGNTDVYLLKVDSSCTYQWSKGIGGGNNDWGYSVKETFDHGFIIASSSNSYGGGTYNVVLNKLDSLGNNVWEKVYGGQDWDFVYSVIQTYDTGYVFCGETYNNSNGFSDVYVVKTNSIGDTLWTRNYGGSFIDKGNSVIETSDSNIVVAGVTNTAADSTDIYVIKLSPDGTLIWDSIYGDSLYENANSIIEMSNGDFVIAGNTTSKSVGGDQDYLIKGIDDEGKFLWDFVIVNMPSPTPDDENAFDVIQLPNNELLVTGYSKTGASSRNIIFYHLSSSGFWAGNSNVVGTLNDDYLKSIAIGNNGEIVFAGVTETFGQGRQDILLVRLDTIYSGQDTVLTQNVDAIPLGINMIGAKAKKISVYPNPTSDYFVLSERIGVIESERMYNVWGREVLFTKNSGVYDIERLSAGIYFLNLEYSNGNLKNIKIIKD